jgi:hypothetical protein
VHEIGGGHYYFNARWYDSSTGRFTSEDPVRDGINWFVYVGNNPLRYTDPTGLLSDEHREALRDHFYYGSGDLDTYNEMKAGFEAQERAEIDYLLRDYQVMLDTLAGVIEASETVLRQTEEFLPSREEDLLRMMGEYNRDIIPRSVQDYGGERMSDGGYFEADYSALGQDPHPGMDFVGGAGFETPWYTFYEESNLLQGSHPVVLSVPGTSVMLRVKHADLEDVQAVVDSSGDGRFGGMYRPGEVIMPFPER